MTLILSVNDIVAKRKELARTDSEKSPFKRLKLKKNISEMITTSQGFLSLIEKVRVDVEFGQAEVPILYKPVYETIAGPFAGKAVQLGENTLEANVIFLQKFEGGEVQFGTLKKDVPKTIGLQTYAAGFEYTEDMEEWDSTWELEMLNRAFGRAYNHLLNHLHLSPIISYTYVAANKTAAQGDSTSDSLESRTLQTFKEAYKQGVSASPQRTPGVVLANEADRFQIEDGLLLAVRDSQGNPLPRVPVSAIIYYNGATISNGLTSVTYSGVTSGKCYFIFPQQKMKEFEHHGLRIDADNADISRLIEAQIVGRTRRGLYADVAGSVEEITLPV